MQIRVEVETFDKMLSFDLFESKEIKYDMEKQVAPNVVIRSKGLDFKEAVGFTDIINLALEIGKDVAVGAAAGLLANWLYDKTRGRAEKLRIEGIDVRIDKGEIKRILIEKIEKSKS